MAERDMERMEHEPRTKQVAILIQSPRAGRGARGASGIKALRAAGVEIAEILDVSALDHNIPQGRRWRAQGYTTAIAAGGDGTIGAVATQLAGSDLPLGILPLGTSNDTARSLGIPLDATGASEVIARGVPIPIDAGQAVPAMTKPFALSSEAAAPEAAPEHVARIVTIASRGAYFLHALTLGLNGAFARVATDIAHRERWGRFTYVASAVEALASFEPVSVTLRLAGIRRWSANSPAPDADGNLVLRREAIQVAAVNLPVFGGELDLRLPHVEPHDSLLDFILIETPDAQHLREVIDVWQEAFRALIRRAHVRGSAPPAPAGTSHASLPVDVAGFTIPGIRRFQAYAASIETETPVDVTLDGEVRARTPVNVRVTPEPVRVLLPRGAHQATQPYTTRG